jgi:hypothetical protein
LLQRSAKTTTAKTAVESMILTITHWEIEIRRYMRAQSKQSSPQQKTTKIMLTPVSIAVWLLPEPALTTRNFSPSACVSKEKELKLSL